MDDHMFTANICSIYVPHLETGQLQMSKCDLVVFVCFFFRFFDVSFNLFVLCCFLLLI